MLVGLPAFAEPKKEIINAKDGSVLLWVPAGSFTMGSEEESPAHRVTLKGYYLGKYPVTNAQYSKFIKATGYQSAGFWDDTELQKGGARKPVCKISWYDAQAYCRWAGLRLPSEAEWERAARGSDERLYPWGKEWSPENVPKGQALFVVGSCPRGASPYGCLDMLGNAREWCSSAPDPYPYVAGDGREKALTAGTPFDKDLRSVRGGPGEVTATHRGHAHASSFDYGLGFRVAR
jgi:formylglycine-generating enzyme required for sulfatase activity